MFVSLQSHITAMLWPRVSVFPLVSKTFRRKHVIPSSDPLYSQVTNASSAFLQLIPRKTNMFTEQSFDKICDFKFHGDFCCGLQGYDTVTPGMHLTVFGRSWLLPSSRYLCLGYMQIPCVLFPELVTAGLSETSLTNCQITCCQ